MEEDHNIQTVTTFKQRLPKLHKDILLISLKNYTQIKKTYSAVLGLNAIDHLSVNIVNPDGEIVFLSSTPYTGINVCGGDLWRYDSSIHPSTYENKNFYWWEDCYSVNMKALLKLEKEDKNNLSFGFIVTKKIQDFYVLYSFATKEKDPDIKELIQKYKNVFVDMGDYCYSEIMPLYEQYSSGHNPPCLKSVNFPKNKE